MTNLVKYGIICVMNTINRLYTDVIRKHLSEDRQMIFISGPRQVGKTTLGEGFQSVYLNWDKTKDRAIILGGEDAVMEFAGGDRPRAQKPVLVLDEIHHYGKWKSFLKGFFDAYWKNISVIVTGSARLNVYKRGGDSLMGRYFPYRVHPLSVGELLDPHPLQEEIRHTPSELAAGDWERLVMHGGFPEPYLKNSAQFTNRWRRLRFEQLLRDDIRADTNIRELDQLEAMAQILSQRSGEQLVYASLGGEVQVNEVTVRNWISVLSSFFFGFTVRTWSSHIENSIRKTPKWYLRDWSGLSDMGKRSETMVACHLLKAVEFWTDMGFGEYGLHYLRDKQKREVDFLVTKDRQPWFLVEVKTGNAKLSPELGYFQKALQAKHAFQVVFDLPYEQIDVFDYTSPVVVPAKTFLAQLP